MTRNHEKLLMAALVGIIIAGAAAFAIQPALASTSIPAIPTISRRRPTTSSSSAHPKGLMSARPPRAGPMHEPLPTS